MRPQETEAEVNRRIVQRLAAERKAAQMGFLYMALGLLTIAGMVALVAWAVHDMLTAPTCPPGTAQVLAIPSGGTFRERMCVSTNP